MNIFIKDGKNIYFHCYLLIYRYVQYNINVKFKFIFNDNISCQLLILDFISAYKIYNINYISFIYLHKFLLNDTA